MSNLTKTLSLTFAVLLIITLVTRFTGGHSASEVLRTALLSFDPAQIDRLEIANPNRNYPVVLIREDGKWLVENQDGTKTFPADERLVTSALEELAGIQIDAVVARTPDRHARYHVDAMGTKVQLFAKNRLQAGVIVGRFHFQSQTQFYTYVRPQNSDDVFTVAAFLNATVARDIPAWRDKKIWEIPPQSITAVDFVYPADSSYTITYAGGNIWMAGADTLNTSLVNNLTKQLAEFSAHDFPALEMDASEFTDEKYLITISEESGNKRTIRIRPAENKNQFEAVAEGYPYVFTLNRNRFKNAVLMPKSELLP